MLAKDTPAHLLLRVCGSLSSSSPSWCVPATPRRAPTRRQPRRPLVGWLVDKDHEARRKDPNSHHHRTFPTAQLMTELTLVPTARFQVLEPRSSKESSSQTSKSSTSNSKRDNKTMAADSTATADKAAGGKGTARRDALRANELAVQKLWEESKVYESDASAEQKEKFIVTFPYPYSNGMLHIGHAFSLTKAVFRAQFERHMGKNVLFPFAFHCTGMPIQAVSTNHTNDDNTRLVRWGRKGAECTLGIVENDRQRTSSRSNRLLGRCAHCCCMDTSLTLHSHCSSFVSVGQHFFAQHGFHRLPTSSRPR